MRTKKIIALLVAFVMTISFAAVAFAASGEGYFGSGASPEDIIPDPGYDDYDDDGYEPVYPSYETTEQKPVLPPMPEEDNTVSQPSTQTTPMRTTKAVADKREKNSEDTTKVINSYGLSTSAAKFLIARHNDAAKGQGNREKAERYERILKANQNDYLAAYRLAQVNFEMGRNGQAAGWVNRCLQIFPNYMPARRLKTKIEGALKR